MGKKCFVEMKIIDEGKKHYHIRYMGDGNVISFDIPKKDAVFLWHDLEKNPDDLPDKEDRHRPILVELKIPDHWKGDHYFITRAGAMRKDPQYLRWTYI